MPAPPTHWQGLRQRFDAVALRPPAASAGDAALADRDAATRAALLAWCSQGAGPGGTPFWRPGGLPRVTQRLSIGALYLAPETDTGPLPINADNGHGHGQAPAGTHGGTAPAALTAWIDHVARQLDGSLHLEALPGRAAGLAYRLGVKWHDALWWRQRQADDPWDAGWALDTPVARQRLQIGFQPRRATLILADTAAAERLQPGLAALWQRQHGFRHAVRWLWVNGHVNPTAPAGMTATHFKLR